MALKAAHIGFTGDEVKKSDLGDGLYLGVEIYAPFARNLYVGGEIGYAGPEGSVVLYGADVDTALTFIPFEVNMRYLRNVMSGLDVGAGAGLSYSYIEEKATTAGITVREDDYVFGAQMFVEASYATEEGFVGLFAKYHLTEDFADSSYDYSNMRLGMQAGWFF